MDQRAFLELTGFLDSFPQTSGNPDATMKAYELALVGLSTPALIEACQRFSAGLVEGQSLDFAPAAPRFAQEARSRQEYIDLKAKPRLPAPRYFPGPLAPFQIRQQKRLSQYANHPILFENVSYDQFRKMSAMKEIPVGAFWTSMGIVYGPAPKHQIEGERNVG